MTLSRQQYRDIAEQVNASHGKREIVDGMKSHRERVWNRVRDTGGKTYSGLSRDEWRDLFEDVYFDSYGAPNFETINPDVVPIGNSGFYWNGNEPIDPRNCNLWPTSPYCGGSIPFDPREISSQIGIPVNYTASSCEVCISVNAAFLGVNTPPVTVCYRRKDAECQLPTFEPPEPPEPIREPRDSWFPQPIAKPNQIRLLFACNVANIGGLSIGREDNWSAYGSWAPTYGDSNPIRAEFYDYLQENFNIGITVNWFQRSDQEIEPGIVRARFDDHPWTRSTYGLVTGQHPSQIFNTLEGGDSNTMGVIGINGHWKTARAVNQGLCSQPFSFTLSNGIVYEGEFNWNAEDFSVLHWVDIPCEEYQSSTKLKEFIRRRELEATNIAFPDYAQDFSRTGVIPKSYSPKMKFIGIAENGCAPRLIKPSPQPKPDKPMDCCEETLELLEIIADRLGVDEFPVKAPTLLTDDPGKADSTATMENHAQLWEWLARNMDALAGQFPIKIKIEDSNLVEAGNQELEIELPNLSETLAEIFGLAYQAEIKTDLLSEILLRLVPEVIAAKNASIIGQSYSKANASYLGYPGNFKTTEVSSNFNLKESKKLPELLKESKSKILTWKDESKDTLEAQVQRLLYAAGIIKSVFVVGEDGKQRFLETVNKLFDDQADAINSGGKLDFDEWLKKWNNDARATNKDQSLKPQILKTDVDLGEAQDNQD